MKYDFNKIIERKKTDSIKWNFNKNEFNAEDILPMWVADMDFPCPEPVAEAIKKRAEHTVFGYPIELDSCYEAVIEKVKRDYRWKIEKDWIVFCDGVVGGLYASVKAFAQKGEEVIIQEPVFHHFRSAIEDNNCYVKNNELSFDGENYTMNYEDLKNYFHDSKTLMGNHAKMMILSSPHNPVGRVWSKDELMKLGEICLENNCVIISDEIHCDVVFKRSQHTTFASISEEFANHSVTFIAPGKTFNISGLGEAVAIIPNKDMRDKFIAARGAVGSGNVFGKVALEAAYIDGEEYLLQLKEYLEDNLNYFINHIEKKIPKLKVIRPEGTFLVWVDMRELGLNNHELNEFLVKEAKVKFNDGAIFGRAGEGFQRINIGCPRIYIKEALIRLEMALRNRSLL
ncbi:cystathionine beta-lyase [Clostridium algifaecis]|uniref:cysteine-S-conjugate beta-lyase n=1 Tax=Clostridium algifaecis TaxID=1472040 RepID=A0ABS4KTR7_9CLOT|nr:MalY/PatB family protein [Clostridium algifaecis]MBP2033451.1 cystathionine beta-lyase [Clostridium algifaecis]